MKFMVEIELGTKPMKSYEDIARILEELTWVFMSYYGQVEEGQENIYDSFSNRIGQWQISEQKDTEEA